MCVGEGVIYLSSALTSRCCMYVDKISLSFGDEKLRKGRKRRGKTSGKWEREHWLRARGGVGVYST